MADSLEETQKYPFCFIYVNNYEAWSIKIDLKNYQLKGFDTGGIIRFIWGQEFE